MTSSPHSRLRKSLEITVVLCLLTACSASPAPRAGGPEWGLYRGDLARDGHPFRAALDAAGASRLTRVWVAHLDGAVDGTPVVANGLVIAGTAGGMLAALDAGSGRQRWAVRGLGSISSSPTLGANDVFVTTLTGGAYAFDLTGRRMWEWTGPPSAALWSSPVFYRDEVIVAIASPYGDEPLVAGRLYGLDASTGRVRWMTCIRAGCVPGDGIWSTPAIDSGGTAFVGVGNPDDGVLAFDPLTGERKWLTTLYPDRDRDLDVGASPVVFTLQGREVIAQATVEGMFAVLDARSGDVLWSRELVAGTAVHGLLASPAYDGTTLFVASASDPTGMIALSPSDGSVRWRHRTDLPVYSAPVVGTGAVLFGTGAVFGDLTLGSLEALSASDGSVLWSYDTHSAVRSGPALLGTMVVVGDQAGDVMAFQPNDRKRTAP
jgi:polyvinyl alcohol dehydrogenase (cytochrome)